VLVVLGLLGALDGAACGQSFVIDPSQLNIVVPPEFRHAEQRVPISGTAPGFDFSTLSVTSDASWVLPSINGQTRELVLTYQTADLIASSSTATISVTGGGTNDSLSVKASLAPLNVITLVDDPVRSRMYGIQQNGIQAGALIVLDPLTNAKLACVTVGRRPTDLAVSKDGSELLVLNAVDKTLTAIDLSTLQVKETITLPTFTNWDEAETSGDVGYGDGNVIYYTDGAWAPVLYVFDRSTGQVLQEVTDDTNGFGDFALTPDGTTLIGWTQYGWTAGWAGSYLVKYTVAANGTLTFAQRTSSTSPTVLERDPLDTPVLIDAAGERVFAKEIAVAPGNIVDTVRSFPSAVFSISPGGEIAATDTGIYQVSTNVNLHTLPVRTTVHAITSDYARLIYFDKTGRTLGAIKLLEVIGPDVLGLDLSPVDGSITLSPGKLEWSPLPGVGKYHVYLGTSESEVTSAGPGDGSYLGEVLTPSIALSTALTPGTKYFWRVDAVSPGEIAKGDVYEFTVSTIGTNLAKVEGATVQGHANYQIEVELTSSVDANWTATADKAWVGFAAASGTAPGTLSVQLNASQLAAGIHTATITVEAGGQTAFTLPVTLEVDPLALTVLESDKGSRLVYGISEKTETTPGAASRAYLLELDSSAKVIKRVVRVGSGVTDIAVHNRDGRIYVTNWMAGVLLALDKTTLKQVQGYGFTAPDGYTTEDVYRIAAGAQGRLLIESQDQWITLGIFDTVAGKMLQTRSQVRQGGGDFDPTGRYYYHGDSNNSDASIHKYDVIGDAFNELTKTRVESFSYYGSRTVVVSEDGERIFWNGAYLDKALAIQWLIGEEIFSTSADGKLAFSSTKIYDVDARQPLLSMPVTTKVSAYNSTSEKLVVQVGDQVKFFDLGVTLEAPVLTVGTVVGSSVQLNWTDDSLETGFTLQYRVKNSVDWTDAAAPIPGNMTTFTQTGLAPQTEYEFRIKADSAASSSPWSEIVSATTAAVVLPTAVTGAATDVTTVSATLRGMVNGKGFPASAYFQYGPTSTYGSSTYPISIGAGTADVPTSWTISKLSASTTYHYRLVVTTAEGTTFGEDVTFTTPAVKPALGAAGPILITGESATLRANVNPNGSAANAYFEYGTTPSLGQSTPPQFVGGGSSSILVQEPIASLTPNTVYYYRAVANNAGGTTFGTLATFRTADVPVEVRFQALDDVTFTIKGETRVIDVLANDDLPAQASLTVTLVDSPSAGSATVNGDGNIVYVPGDSFAGNDSFSYMVSDALRSSTATIVVRDTFQSSTGVYNGLIGTAESAYDQAGWIVANASRGGQITGKVMYEGGSYSFKTNLRYDGVATAEVKRKGANPLLLSLSVDPVSQKMTGTVGATEATEFSANRAPYNRLNPAPQAGSYTLVLAIDSEDTTEGNGFATMKVDESGTVRLKGRSRTGQPFSSSALVDSVGTFPLYAYMKKDGGTKLHGTLQFRHVATVSDFDGVVGSSSAESDEVAQISAVGSRYIVPGKGAMVLPYADSANNAFLNFGHGDSSLTEAPYQVTLSAKGLKTTAPELSKLKLNAKTGLFSGKLSVEGKRRPFYGVVLQRQARGFGLFHTTETAGWMSLTDANIGEPETTDGGVSIDMGVELPNVGAVGWE
ncbi:MAG: Ig-like domain-containing protein, partial [Chthoniobacteraceae bacterium]